MDCFDGAPLELLDRGPKECERHPWFIAVWVWGRGRMDSGDLEDGTPEPDNCANEKVMFPGTTAGSIRELSDFAFYEMTQQMSFDSAAQLMAVRRGAE
jgi:hypothetical protein